VHIAGQLLRSGTSPAPNYGEARGAESRADFVRNLGIALKELNETKVWLKMLARAKLAASDTVSPVLDECQQLARIMNASIQTARRSSR
jgi:four helix bundle protein